MKRLTEEEYNTLAVKGKGRSSELFNSIINLKPGEAILIEEKDWNRKAGPSTLVNYIEKKTGLKLTCAALMSSKGWVVKRIDTGKDSPDNIPAKKIGQNVFSNSKDENNLQLKYEIALFYLGRISLLKIEKIEETTKALQAHFIDEDRSSIKNILLEIIELLAKQQHIIIENEKTYIPLKRN